MTNVLKGVGGDVDEAVMGNGTCLGAFLGDGV